MSWSIDGSNMKDIFIGFILIFLDFNLNLGNSKIGLIPDFAGYLIMINGILEMSEESTLFTKVKPQVTAMAVYSGILYLLDLIGLSTGLGIGYILGIISTVITLYISYNIVMGVIDTEKKYNRSLDAEHLKTIWTFLAVMDILTFALVLIPAVSIICMVVLFIAILCFLIAFNNSKNLYYEIIE